MVFLKIDIPKTMYEAAREAAAEGRPYDVCLSCPFMKETCDGPNVLAMDDERWVKWADARRKVLGLTKQQLAELSGVPLGTVNNVLAGKTADMRRSTLRDLTRVLVGGCWGQYPCHFAALLMRGELAETISEDEIREKDAELDKLRARVRHLEGTLEGIHTSYNSELAQVREEAQRRVDFLRSQIDVKDGQIKALNARIDRQDAIIDRFTREG